MSEKARDIIDTLLCGLYMAVFCVPTIYLTIGIVKYLDWNGALTFVCPIVCGILSGTAIFSDSKKKAGLKWLTSAPLSVGGFFVIGNTDLVKRMYNAIDPLYYAEYGALSMGEAFSGAAVLYLGLLAVFIGNIIGLSCCGIELTRKGENVLAVLQKIVCPILCVVIVGVTVYLLCALPQLPPPVYG